MKRLNSWLLIFWIFVVFICQGCAPVADPRDGGLFGYSPELYKQRLDERQQTLKRASEKKEVNQENSMKLDEEISTQQAEIEKLQHILNSMDSELLELQKRVMEKQHLTEEAKKKQVEINHRIKEIMYVREQTGRQIENGMLADKEAEVQKLKEKLKYLMAEAELLGQL